ncbi:hypothetical protein Tco_0866777 [Tanacetum coccineum]
MNCQLLMYANVMNRSIGIDIPVRVISYHWANERDQDSATSGSLERPPSLDPYEVTITRWRSRVAVRSSPPSSPTHDLPPSVRQIVPAPPGLTRYPLDHSSTDHFSSDDSSSDSSSDYSSGHSLPDSSFSSDDSSFDTPATISAGPSRKRHRSPATLVPLAIPTSGDLSPGSYEAYTELDIDSDVQANIDADTSAVETAATLEVSIGIEADVGLEVGIGIEREDEVEEEVESWDRGGVEADSRANRNRGPTMESGDENGNDNGNGDCLGGGNGNGNPNVNVGGVVPVTRECTYQDFMKCQPLNFKGTEGVIGLTRWFEKTIVGTDVAYAMSWKALMKLMTKVYCPRNEIQKMETELWNLAVMGNDLNAYT